MTDRDRLEAQQDILLDVWLAINEAIHVGREAAKPADWRLGMYDALDVLQTEHHRIRAELARRVTVN